MTLDRPAHLTAAQWRFLSRCREWAARHAEPGQEEGGSDEHAQVVEECDRALAGDAAALAHLAEHNYFEEVWG